MAESRSLVIIDSDQAYLDLMHDFLGDLGFHVLRWLGSDGAVEFVERHDPDLIILDSWLATPADGQRLLDVLHANPATRDIPVIVVTSDASFRQSEHNRVLARAIIDKPFDLNDLEASIRAILSQRLLDVQPEARNAPAGTGMIRVVPAAESQACLSEAHL